MQSGPADAAAAAPTTTAAGPGSQQQQLQELRQQHREIQQLLDPDSGDDGNGNSGDDRSDGEGDGDPGLRGLKRKRPISVSCELCKQRKVKCDRGQPSCGWCTRNGAVCEYKERKKPGLRAGYGRELEARLDKLEAVLRRHSEVLQIPFDGQHTTLLPGGFHAATGVVTSGSVRGSNASLASDDHGTPQEPHQPPPPPPPPAASLFARVDAHTPQAEAALFLQKPSRKSFSGAPPAGGGVDLGMAATAITPAASSLNNAAYAAAAAGLSPSHQSQPSPLSTPAAREFYGGGTGTGTGAPAGGGGSPLVSLGPEQADLPPYDLSYALVDLYFKHINTWCPLLQRNATIEALFGASMTEETNRILLHAIVATTLRFSTDARLSEEKRQRYHDLSKQRVLLYGMENSSVKALQAMVILALDLCGSSNGPPGWNIMALITRAVVQLGLAVETNSFSVSPGYTSIYTLRAMILPEPRDFIEEESRRRLFWVIYLLDRYATITTAFQFALDDSEIDRSLPCRDDLWAKNQKVETRLFPSDGGGSGGSGDSDSRGFDGDAAALGRQGKPENLGAFSYYIEILGILTKIHNFLKQPVDISSLSDVEQWQMRYRALDQMLTGWKLGIPGEYGNMAKLFQPGQVKTLNCGWVMLHVTYHMAIIRLHSSSAYPTTRSPIFTPSYSASQRCHSAVEHIAALSEFVVAHGLLPKLGPPFAFSLWVAARLLLVHGSTVEHKLSPRVPFFVDTLRAMGRCWPVALRYSALLQRVLDEHRDSERQGDGVTPSSVKILADMRRTAFDLDLLISRQPRHVTGGFHGYEGQGQGQVPAPAPSQTAAPRLSGVTPARTPQPNELEYLDVFDFFNVPRLPFAPAELHNDSGNGTADSGADDRPGASSFTNEFNITDFMIDANQDWLFKQEGSKPFLA